jgi:hypothetical protein
MVDDVSTDDFLLLRGWLGRFPHKALPRAFSRQAVVKAPRILV